MPLLTRMAVCRYAADIHSFPLLQGAPVPSNEEFRVQVLRSYNILDTVRKPLCKEVPRFSAGPAASCCVHIGKSKTSCKPVASLCRQLSSGSTYALNLEGGMFPSKKSKFLDLLKGMSRAWVVRSKPLNSKIQTRQETWFAPLFLRSGGYIYHSLGDRVV
jgi:hypothetical protein